MPTIVNLQNVIIRDVIASRPAAGSVSIGALFLASDTGAAYRNNGTSWDAWTAAGATQELVNAQTGTSYTIVSGDLGKLATFSNASAVAVTLPQATGSFGAGWFADIRNLGAGVVTITPTTSTIAGGSTLVLNQNESARIISDGTNYQVTNLVRVASGLTKYTSSWTSQTSVTVTHSLGTKDVSVSVYDASDVKQEPESVTTTSTSVVTLTFGSSFTGRVVVIG